MADTKTKKKKSKKKRKPAASVHYVNNQELVNEILQYKKEIATAKKSKTGSPQMSEALGVMLLKICTRLSESPNFSRYTFREDMVGDAIENCLSYITNFNPAKSNNAFAYVTQIAYFAFLRRIQREEKQQYVKIAATERAGILGLYQDFNRAKYEKHLHKKKKSLKK